MLEGVKITCWYFFGRGVDAGGVELVGGKLLIVARLLLGADPVLCPFDVMGRRRRCSMIEFSSPGRLGSTERARVVRSSPMVLSVLSWASTGLASASSLERADAKSRGDWRASALEDVIAGFW